MLVVAPVGGGLNTTMSPRLYVVEPWRQLVDQHVLLRLQRPLHRLLLDLVRLGDEVLDDDEDDEGQDERLDDLEETPERGSLAHKSGSIGAAARDRRQAVRNGPTRAPDVHIRRRRRV